MERGGEEEKRSKRTLRSTNNEMRRNCHPERSEGSIHEMEIL
jgi:hypothetical protein